MTPEKLPVFMTSRGQFIEVGPSFKKVLGTDTDLDGSGVRRIWHRGARKTELLTWEAEDGAIVRQELTF